MIVDGISGESDFTRDPNRHMIMEARIEPPPSNVSTGVLPDRRTADLLVQSYFVNVKRSDSPPLHLVLITVYRQQGSWKSLTGKPSQTR
jgi:hypothetical protein